MLLIQHNDQGALGVVVNRPTSKTCKELWKDVGESPCKSRQPIFLGGPEQYVLEPLSRQQH